MSMPIAGFVLDWDPFLRLAEQDSPEIHAAIFEEKKLPCIHGIATGEVDFEYSADTDFWLSEEFETITQKLAPEDQRTLGRFLAAFSMYEWSTDYPPPRSSDVQRPSWTWAYFCWSPETVSQLHEIAAPLDWEQLTKQLTEDSEDLGATCVYEIASYWRRGCEQAVKNGQGIMLVVYC
ncbi:hypothetical protein Pan44_44370 [Caulifigura coniformis]|uniref:DUF1877 family protein n=1 Tax=Caulifigura coniformis TaxID=2527983 RepID=A0A517SJS4_9PLAN|nr:hypothetical protein [Caulifigura coniformis]QDT56383.1 hypothetical protein Pan44_44370 [Caulifigura coniformis]